MKLKVFGDDLATFMEKGQHKGLPGVPQKVLRAMRREVEKKGLNLSITEGWKEGKSKVIEVSWTGRVVSGMQQERRSRTCNQCGNMRRRFKDETEAAGSKGEGQKANMKCEVFVYQDESRFPEELC